MASTPKTRLAQRYADNLAACRRAKDWTHAQVAEMAVVSIRTVYRWEAGDGLPTADHLETLEAMFGKSSGWFGLDHGHGLDPNQEDAP